MNGSYRIERWISGCIQIKVTCFDQLVWCVLSATIPLESPSDFSHVRRRDPDGFHAVITGQDPAEGYSSYKQQAGRWAGFLTAFQTRYLNAQRSMRSSSTNFTIRA